MGKRGLNFACTDKQLAILVAVLRGQTATGSWVSTSATLELLQYKPTLRNLRCSMGYLEDYQQLESRRVSDSAASAIEWRLTQSGMRTLNDNKGRITAGLRL